MSSQLASSSSNVPAPAPAKQSLSAPEVAGERDPALTGPSKTTSKVPVIQVSSADQQQAAEAPCEVPAKDDVGKPGQAVAADSATTTVVSGPEGETDNTSKTITDGETDVAGGQRDIKKKKNAIERASRFVGVAASKVVGLFTIKRKQPRTPATAPVGESAEAEKDTLQPPTAGKEPTRKSSLEVIQDAAKAVVGEALEGYKTGKMDDDTVQEEPTAGDNKAATSSTDVKNSGTAVSGERPATTNPAASTAVPGTTAAGSQDKSTAVVKEGAVAASSAT
ncbi:hypothetical protein HDU87_000497 [Geranomyces variabilis]|uniref:Uncharacterized protein n=1 Tax=Geranomyces variabilis TaxID=109894 RepID=A0AAD5TER3_9FUNG|nr:hypothetical protein HDU87_000497 [Geranomyces variabilis]